jgi:PhzF family phenazine biosynthesis protein
MRRYRFQQVDVFTNVPYKGNPVAVVLDSAGLSTAEMQAIANWTNLSETTFVEPPQNPAADYRLRIFTPRAELPFAGHPTIGSAYAVLQSGHTPRTPGSLVQECGKGLIDLRLAGDRLFFRLPPPEFKAAGEKQIADAAAGLGRSCICHRARGNRGCGSGLVHHPTARRRDCDEPATGHGCDCGAVGLFIDWFECVWVL